MKPVFFITLILGFSQVFAQDIEKGSYLSLYKKQSRKLISKTFLPEALHYGVKNGDKILDIGGNDGSLIIPLSLVADSIDYYLEDTHSDYFPLAGRTFSFVSEKINPTIRFNLHTIQGSDSLIPLSGVSFDRVIIRETFHHFTEPKLMLKETKRLLSASGELKITEPADPKKFKHCHLLSSEVLIKIVTTEGFKYVSTAETPLMIIYTFRQ